MNFVGRFFVPVLWLHGGCTVLFVPTCATYVQPKRLNVVALPFHWRVTITMNVWRKKTVRYFVGEKRSSKGVKGRLFPERSIRNDGMAR